VLLSPADCVVVVIAPLKAPVPVTARALDPMVAPPSARDVPVPMPMLVLVTPKTVHAMISTISLTAHAVPRTTVVPVDAVYSEVDSFEPL